MSHKLQEVLHNASKEELIDIIVERMYMDPVFMRTIEHRFVTDDIPDTDDQIGAYKDQVEEEMTRRCPNTTIIRAAGNALNRKMEHWSVYDCCRGCIAVIRTLDGALANGAGMEDETDFEISMDVEAAAEYAKDRIRQEMISGSEKERITALFESEIKKPLDVFGEDIFAGILDELRKN